MGLKEFSINFDSQAIYQPGNTISGQVVLTLDSAKKTRGINFIVKGAADTYWSDTRETRNDKGSYENLTEYLSAHEEYFKIQYYLLGSSSGEQIELPAGTHTYPFSCALPPNLPSSFESPYGRVRYTIKAVVDRPWKFNQETKTAFTVISTLDLNQQPNASDPIRKEMSKTFCCLCCGSPPLTINVDTPVRGYVPGQPIPVKFNIENQSGVDIETVKLILQRVVTYKATSPRNETKVDESTVAEVSKGPVKGRDTLEYEQRLDVPSAPPSNLANCGIIDLEYRLKVEAVASGWYHRNLVEYIPILIGTVPLSDYQLPQPAVPKMDYGDGGDYPSKQNDLYPSVTPTAPDEPNNQSPPPAGFTLYPNLAPPSYEEAMYRSRSIRERGESDYVIGAERGFAPRYPVYNFSASH